MPGRVLASSRLRARPNDLVQPTSSANMHFVGRAQRDGDLVGLLVTHGFVPTLARNTEVNELLWSVRRTEKKGPQKIQKKERKISTKLLVEVFDTVTIHLAPEPGLRVSPMPIFGSAAHRPRVPAQSAEGLVQASRGPVWLRPV